MASSMVVKVACLAVMMCMVLGVPLAYAAIPCGQAQVTVAPCLGYVRGPGAAIPAPCCNGLRTLNSQARTTPDRQAVCQCLKSTVLSIPGLNLAKLAALPGKCGVNLPYKISPSIDCSMYVDHWPWTLSLIKTCNFTTDSDNFWSFLITIKVLNYGCSRDHITFSVITYNYGKIWLQLRLWYGFWYYKNYNVIASIVILEPC